MNKKVNFIEVGPRDGFQNVKEYIPVAHKVKVIEPLPHSKLLDILTQCKLVITDSGGLQEEGTFFNKKVIVCRLTTERPEGIETGHLHLCEAPTKLKSLFDSLVENYYINTICPYGDGYSSQRVKQILTQI